MAEHEHGSMNYDAQEKTFDGFMTFVTRSVVVILAILVLLAIFAG
ncbi:aa3-type cytochrome c oxidase subunit IV [Sulfitobacter sp. W027]|jgi:fumarate reductase subunit C|nr:aa3-type cytochrome c oxidase subunit IV [Sulfitobacter sp. W027]UWR34126.1 aa3-type cytochrome c oxidase subunit IV [Sulfitobacter sp. W027]|tara:strand:+ start:311 stop:445 length:135 start_codon:yes stop_codon:yes gene_type:complete